MDFHFRLPAHPELRPHVALLWTWSGAARHGVFERLMPNGEPALIVNLKDDCIRVYDKDTLALSDHMRGAVLVGVQTQPMVIDGDEQERVFGIQFRAGGAFPFLSGMPSGEVTNLHVDLRDLWTDGNTLREQLLAASGPEAMFQIAEKFLLERRAIKQRHAAVDYALRQIAHGHPRPVAELVGEIGLSARRFIQLFREQTGVAPKTYCRIRRFQRVIDTVYAKRRADWADVAAACGYHDQAHCIREFREFSGMTPTSYLARATSHKNHVPV